MIGGHASRKAVKPDLLSRVAVRQRSLEGTPVHSARINDRFIRLRARSGVFGAARGTCSLDYLFYDACAFDPVE
jgi:hypothetical protein